MKLVSFTCDRCGAELLRATGQVNRARRRGYGIYCSDSCRRDPDLDRECPTCHKQFRVKRTNTRPNRGKYCSRKCYNAWQQTEANRNENHPNWTGGTNDRDKNRVEYKQWRTAVYKRDGYTCQACGAHGGELRGHHIKTVKHYPELELDIANGVTMCKGCHTDIHRGPLKKECSIASFMHL